MPDIEIAPIIMTDSTLTLGLNGYQGHVSKCQFTPSGGSIVVWKGLKPTSKFSMGTQPTWTLDLDYAQDWETASALSQYLLEHKGETVHAVLEPVAGGAGYEAMVIITPGPIGGTVDTIPTGSVSLGVTGDPTKVV